MATKSETNRKIGAAMRSLRGRSGLTDAEVAVRMGYDPTGKVHVSRWERGERGITAERLLSYLKSIGASFADLDRELSSRRSQNRRLREIARELKGLARTNRA